MHNEIATDNIDLAAYLLLQKATLSNVALMEDSRFVQFTFTCDTAKERWALLNAWHGGLATVAAKPYGKAIGRIKVIIHSVKYSSRPQKMSA